MEERKELAKTVLVKSANVARRLIQAKFPIKDIMPHKSIKDRTVFIFYFSKELEGFLKEME